MEIKIQNPREAIQSLDYFNSMFQSGRKGETSDIRTLKRVSVAILLDGKRKNRRRDNGDGGRGESCSRREGDEIDSRH